MPSQPSDDDDPASEIDESSLAENSEEEIMPFHTRAQKRRRLSMSSNLYIQEQDC